MSHSDKQAQQLRTRARIAAHALWDLMIRPDALSADDVPFHAEAVTAEWITDVLAGDVPGAVAEQVKIVGGDDGSSVRRGIVVRWNEAGAAASLPTRLFAKSTPTLATRLSAGMAAPSEGRFLKELRPDLAIEAPVCRYSARDSASGRSLHLFDDLTVTRGRDISAKGTRRSTEGKPRISSIRSRRCTGLLWARATRAT